MTSAFYALVTLEQDHTPEKASEVVAALLAPVVEASRLEIARNALRKSLQLLRSLWEGTRRQAGAQVVSSSRNERNEHNEVSSDDQNADDMDRMAIVLFRHQKLLDGRSLSEGSDETVFREFLASYEAQDILTRLAINRDGPVLYPREENIFSPSMRASERIRLLQSHNSPLFEGRPDLSRSRRSAPSEDADTRPTLRIFL